MRRMSVSDLRELAQRKGFELERSSVKGKVKIRDETDGYALNPGNNREVFSIDAALRYLAEQNRENRRRG
jgi:hypothetical protein